MQGLYISNDSGDLQISSEYQDMALKYIKHSSNNSIRDAELFAIRSDDNSYMSPRPPPNMGGSGYNTGSGLVYEFTINFLDVATKEKLGLELFNTDGQTYYNSNYNSISVIDSVSIDTDTSNTIFFQKDYGDKKIAVILQKDIAYFHYQPYAQRTNVFTSVFNITSTNTLTVRMNETFAIGANYTPPPAKRLEFLVIDVTNY